MQIVRITEQEKNSLLGEKWDDETFFNPMLDADNEWFVSIEEVYGCNKQEFQWLKSCELIEYNPVISNFPF